MLTRGSILTVFLAFFSCKSYKHNSNLNDGSELDKEQGLTPGFCGQRVHESAFETWRFTVVNTFSNYDAAMKNIFCAGLLSETFGDIKEFLLAEKKFKSRVENDEGTCGTGIYAGTIGVKDKCHFAGEVNYIQFGIGNHLCNIYLSSASIEEKTSYNSAIESRISELSEDNVQQMAIKEMQTNNHNKLVSTALILGYRYERNKSSPSPDQYSDTGGRIDWFNVGWEMIDDNYNFQEWSSPEPRYENWTNSFACENIFYGPLTGRLVNIKFPPP